MQRLRIFVVLPLYGGSLPVGRYCVSALRDMGHSVRVFDGPAMYPAHQGLRSLDLTPARLVPLANSFLRLVSQAVWAQAEEQKPELVLALAQAPLDRHVLARMRENGMRTVMWFVEDFRTLVYWRNVAPLYDAFAVIQKEPFLAEIEKIGQKHALYLPLAALPKFHRRLELSEAEKREFGSELSFLGAGYPNRRLAFRQFANRDFKIWGSDWEGETALASNIQRNGERIGEEDAVKIYNASRINLNLHSSVHADKLVSGGDFVNPRTFELAAMGAFQLVDRRSLMPELFADDELATFTSLDELKTRIDYFLAHPDEAQAYAKRAQARVLKNHTYEQRMRKLIEFMEQEFGPWPEQKASQELPPEVAAQVASLTGKLGLAPDATFDDVVARLRQQQGELDETETALLFLDEWCKQYTGKAGS